MPRRRRAYAVGSCPGERAMVISARVLGATFLTHNTKYHERTPCDATKSINGTDLEMAVTETQIMGRGSGARSTMRTQRQCERARGVAKFTVQVELTRVEMVQPHPCMALAFQGVPNPCLTPHRDHHNRKPRDWLCCSLPCRKGIPVRTCCAQTAQHWKAEISSLVAKKTRSRIWPRTCRLHQCQPIISERGST